MMICQKEKQASTVWSDAREEHESNYARRPGAFEKWSGNPQRLQMKRLLAADSIPERCSTKRTSSTREDLYTESGQTL